METWATICDQNNPIISLDLDREECDSSSDLLSNSHLIKSSYDKKKENIFSDGEGNLPR